MNDEAVNKLLDDYTIGELRREAEADRLRAAKSVFALVDKLAAGERIDDLAKLAPVVAQVVAGGRP